MAQMLVRKLEESVKQRLRWRAARNGRSLEEEAREVLRAAVADDLAGDGKLGSAIAARFTGQGLDAPIIEWRGQAVRPADL